MEQPQQAVHFDVVVVPVRGEADEGIGADQAAEPVGIGAAGRHSIGLVDHQTGYVAVALEKPGQPIQHLVVRETAVAGGDNRLHLLKLFRLDDGIERPFRTDPHLRAIRDPLLLQLEGAPVVDVVADVFLVGQDLMDGGAGPGPVEIGQDPALIQFCGDFAFRTAVLEEPAIDPANGPDLGVRPENQYHPVCLQTLVLTALQLCLHLTAFIKQDPAKTKTRRTALTEAAFDQAALPDEDLVGKFPAVFPGHRALDALDDRGHRPAIIFELLGAILDLLVGATADVFVIGGFICILKPAPPADVIDKDQLEIRGAVLHILDQLLQRLATLDPEPTLARIGIGADQFKAAFLRIFADRVRLVFGRVFLMVCRHADIFSRTTPWRGVRRFFS